MRCFLIVLISLFAVSVQAQFTYGTIGLLRMPTADMNPRGTIMAGLNHLSKEATEPHRNGYDTEGYYVNITPLPFLEIGYHMMLRSAELRHWHYISQDRSIHIKLRALYEGQFAKWVPQVVIGANDPLTHDDQDGETARVGSLSSNNYMSRYFIAFTKHYTFGGIGTLGTHFTVIKYDENKSDANYIRPAAGLDFHLGISSDSFGAKMLNGLDLMLEYDARTFNVGASFAPCKYVSVYGELNKCRYLSAGLQLSMRVYK